MKKHTYLIVDTETTKYQTVADFGAVIMTRDGTIIEQFGAMVDGHFGKMPLFSDPKADPEAFWSEQSAQRRAKHYDDMLECGERSISSPALINKWLERVCGQHDPVLTAYNIAFDFGKCRNTKINLGIFGSRFCLMKAAKRHFVNEDYMQFCVDNNRLTPTGLASTTADSMATYIVGNDLAPEPHTALEDARDYEAVILAKILETATRAKLLEMGR
jgi:DNA polymerase III epsilon subunit-like protein